jgi:hypothetical protein
MCYFCYYLDIISTDFIGRHILFQVYLKQFGNIVIGFVVPAHYLPVLTMLREGLPNIAYCGSKRLASDPTPYLRIASLHHLLWFYPRPSYSIRGALNHVAIVSSR